MAFTAFNCSSSKKTHDVNSTEKNTYLNQYLPLGNGNKWVYTDEAAGNESETFTVEVKDVKKTDSGTQIQVTSFPYLTSDNTERTVMVMNNGEIEINNYMGTSGMIFPQADNFKQGYEWSFGIFKGYVTSLNDTVKSADGRFYDCVYVKMTDGFTFSYEMWFKKDTGIVKWGANRTNPPTLKRVYYVLKEHKVK